MDRRPTGNGWLHIFVVGTIDLQDRPHTCCLDKFQTCSYITQKLSVFLIQLKVLDRDNSFNGGTKAMRVKADLAINQLYRLLRPT